jgi:hypothetical protein
MMQERTLGSPAADALVEAGGRGLLQLSAGVRSHVMVDLGIPAFTCQKCLLPCCLEARLDEEAGGGVFKCCVCGHRIDLDPDHPDQLLPALSLVYLRELGSRMCIGLHPMGLSGKLCEEWLAGKIERRKVVFGPGVAEARAAAEAAVVAALHAGGVTDLRAVSDEQRSVFDAESKVRGEVARRARAALQAKLVARRAAEKAEKAQRAAAQRAEKAQRAAAQRTEKAQRVAAQRAAQAQAQRAALMRQELEQLRLLCRVQGGTRASAPQPYSGPEEARAEAHVRIWVLGQVNKRLLDSPGLRVLEAQAGRASSEAAAAAAQLAQRRRASVLQAMAAFQFVLDDSARGGQVLQRVLDSLR